MSDNISKFNPPIKAPYYFDFADKERNVRLYCDLMFNRTQSMFTYTNLPGSIPQYFLENYLQRNGNCCIAEHNGELYCFTGGLGGEWNEYYYPTLYIVANPYLNFSKSYEIGKDCVLIKNDSAMRGLTDINSRYASLLVESDITMRNANILKRLPAIAAVHGDQEKEGLDELTDRIEYGSTRIAITDDIFSSLKTLPFSGVPLTELVEYHQYVKGMWYNEIGISSSFNMKREALNTAELAMNDDMLVPLIDDMLNCRKIAIEQINEMFGTSITVELNSVWEKNIDEVDHDINILNTGVKDEEHLSDERGEAAEERGMEELSVVAENESEEDIRGEVRGRGNRDDVQLSDAQHGININNDDSVDEKTVGDRRVNGDSAIVDVTIKVNTEGDSENDTDNSEEES